MQTRVSSKYKGKMFYTKENFRLSIHNYIITEKIAQFYKHYIEYLFWRFKIAIRKKISVFAFDQIYWVPPYYIVYCTLKEFNPYKYYGVAKAGNWDKLSKKFDKLDVFNAFKSHFIYNSNWKDTEFYQNIANRIKNGHICWGCKSENDFFLRCKRLDELFNEIKLNGYKTQAVLQSRSKGKKLYDEISINIGRNGELLFNNGAHRLSIAKILNIDKIPIRITVCHKNVLRYPKLLKNVVAKLNEK